jgi:glycosyltransferase involved in cell wall biosynthesis
VQPDWPQTHSITQVSTSEYNGGAERVALSLFQAYRQRGYTSRLCVGRKDSDDPDVSVLGNVKYRSAPARFLLERSRHIRGVLGQVRGVSKMCTAIESLAQPGRWLRKQRGIEEFDFPASYDLVRAQSEEPTIIHLHNLHGGYFDLRALPWISRHIPVVLTLHDAWPLSGHCAHSFDCDRWKVGCGDCPDLTIKPAVRRDATAYNWKRKSEIYARSNIAVCTPSDWLMNRVGESMLSGKECRVIPNGIDLAVFRPGDKEMARVALGLPTDADVVLLGRYRPKHDMWKDSRLMEEAMDALGASNRKRKLLFVSWGAERATREFIGTELRWISPQREVSKVSLFYQAADVYVHAAKVDTFPNSIIEALACGVPVVATAVGGIPEQIEDGVTGFLTPPGDTKALAVATSRLLCDFELRSRFSAQAAESARLRFSLDRQADDYLSWYEQLVTKRRDSAPGTD